MSAPEDPTEAQGDSGFLAPKPGGHPVDHCFRCGVETPPGVGLCDEHNVGHLSGPGDATDLIGHVIDVGVVKAS